MAKKDNAEGGDKPQPKGDKAQPKGERPEKKGDRPEKAAKAEKAEKAGKGEPSAPLERIVPRLKTRYDSEIKGRLKERFAIDNPNAVPHLVKIVIDMGVKGAVENKSRVDQAARDLATISGQKAVIKKSKKAISAFKLRENMPIACMVTLRRQRMWEFADRLINVVLPRIRDFRGVKDKLDGRGNFSLGLSEQTVFPEIDFDKVEFQQGMHITFVTSAGTDERGYALLKELGMPFQVRETKGKKKE
jgi:large subunit ribosomal protein L5